MVASLSSLQQGSKQAAAVRGQTGSLPHLGQRPEPQTFSQHLKQTLVSAALPIKLRQAKCFHKEMNKMEIQVDYVTKRDILLEHPTEHWLQIHGLASGGKLVIVNSSEEKIELGYDYYVDDCPKMIELIKPEQTLFLYNQPWNKNAIGDYIRVVAFDDVRSYLMAAKEVGEL